MQISENNSERLVLVDRPLLSTALLVLGFLGMLAIGLWRISAGDSSFGVGAIAFAVLIGGVMLLFVEHTILFLDRPTDTVLFRRKSLFSATQDTARLSDLLTAEVEISRSRDSETGLDSETTRPILVFIGNHSLPLCSHFSSGRGTQRAVDVINAWLAQPRGG